MARTASVGVVTAFALVLAACGGSSSATVDTRTEPSAPAISTTAASPTSIPSPPTSMAGVGKLVVVDGRGDVVTMLPDGTERRALTDDGGTVVHRQPLWSPAGDRLAWADVAGSEFALVISDRVTAVSIPMPALPFFSMWSPDGTRIGVLHNAPGGGLDLEIVDVIEESAAVVAGGAPFYFSWRPDGTQLVSHVGAATLSILGPDGATPLGETAGNFQTPSWTPAGILHVVGGALVLQDPDGDIRRFATVTGPTTMVTSPNGGEVAIQVFGPDDPGVFAAAQSTPELPGNSVVVLDLGSGAFEVALRQTSFGFFWSPDGASLLILLSAGRDGEFEWWVWREGEIITRVAFTPTASLVTDLVPFFDQYAQAWTPWAPDSSAFAFVGTIDGVTGVWIQDLGALEPRFLTEGDWVAWSVG